MGKIKVISKSAVVEDSKAGSHCWNVLLRSVSERLDFQILLAPSGAAEPAVWHESQV